MFTKKNGPKIDEKSRDRFAEFMYRVIEVNKGTDVNNVMDVWAPGERARLLELMGNQAALERNRALFLNIRSSRLVGVIEYGSFYLVYVLHDLVGVGDYVKLYPVTEHDKKLFLSNGLVDDFFYSVIAEQIIGYQWPKK
ncbi:hypothetical protein [Pseudomaricurvus alcaniphilus]|uniref:hypothetical protein n=1 Tax=Pseudomaricurvus alcaniphilus TaxID=1166482 RepID=UPI001A9E4FBA|nr:hypothetical protein [Pseudomaricurvus alcaniphilus]